jgi:hypothetical protein
VLTGLVDAACFAGGLGWVLARKKNGASLKRARKTEKVDKMSVPLRSRKVDAEKI